MAGFVFPVLGCAAGSGVEYLIAAGDIGLAVPAVAGDGDGFGDAVRVARQVRVGIPDNGLGVAYQIADKDISLGCGDVDDLRVLRDDGGKGPGLPGW